MRLKSLEISNFRSIRYLHLQLNENLTSILGNISVGKSSVLLAIELFWNPQILAIEATQAAHIRSYYHSRHLLAKRNGETVEQSVKPPENIHCRYDFIYDPKRNNTFENTPLEHIIKQYHPKEIIVDLVFDPFANTIIRKLGIESWDSNDEMVQWLNYSQSDLQLLHEIIGERTILRFRDETLVDLEETIISLIEKSALFGTQLEILISRVLDEKIQLFVQIEEDRIDPDHALLYIYREGSQSLQPFRYLSTGTQRLIGILTQLAKSDRNQPKILLIDDPELHLHAKAQRELAQIFVENPNEHQLIISTASLKFLIGDIFLANLKGNITSLRRIDANNDNDIELLVHTMGVRPSDSLSADAVVFVEGNIDRAVLEKWLEIVFSKGPLLPSPLIDDDEYISNPSASAVLAVSTTSGASNSIIATSGSNNTGTGTGKNYIYSYHRMPRVAFVPVDGWTKMTFAISVRILRSKYVRSIAYAVVDGDTWETDKKAFTKILQSFESVFGKKTFFRLREPCIESVFLNHPEIIAKCFDVDTDTLKHRLDSVRPFKHDKDTMILLFNEFGQKLKLTKYGSEVAGLIAKEFPFEKIPSRLIRLFRKILWNME